MAYSGAASNDAIVNPQEDFAETFAFMVQMDQAGAYTRFDGGVNPYMSPRRSTAMNQALGN